jgi:hypothetical protein
MRRSRHHFSVLRPLMVWAGAGLLIVLGAACGDKAVSGLRATDSPTPLTSSSGFAVPTLTILSPHSGERVSAPVPIRYRVTKFASGRTTLLLYPGVLGSSPEFAFPLSDATGVVTLEDQPMVSGRRTLTFILAMDDRPLQNPEAQVILRNVVIEGKKGGA